MYWISKDFYDRQYSSAEINALKHNWPNSKHLLCVFNILQAVWRWLWETKNKIPKENEKIL